MGDNNEGIEVKITSQIEKTAQQVKNFAKSFEKAGYELKSFKGNADKLGNTLVTLGNEATTLKFKIDSAGKGVDQLTFTTKNLEKQTNSATRQTKDFKSALGTAFNIGKIYLVWNLTKKIRDTLKDCVMQSIDFTETTNKFQVSMGNARDEAVLFQNKLAEAFGTNRNEMMDYQSTFKNIMSSTAEISSKTAEKISESLTQMGLDYSSLFNVSQKSAMDKFQSALTGSIRPIRSDSGYDISNKALVSTAQNLGVNKTSSQLTEMEKRILRIITLMNQMKNTGAMQDLARTIESPANQLKVLANQLQELKIALGNAFVNTIGQILPYINGFVMALRAVISALSTLFGWAGSSGIGLEEAFEVASDGASGVASGLGAGAKSAKEIKKQLLGFDVLNVISTNKDKDSGAGGGAGVGTIDPKILGALKGYDSLMGRVKMKAIAIRDAIMNWLGFLKKVNPETGEIEWVLRKGYTNLKAIGTILKALVGLFIAKKVISLYGGLRNIVTLLGGGEPKLKAFQSGLQGIGSLFKTGSTNSTTFEKGISKLLTSFGKLALGVGGTALAIKGFVDLSKETTETLEKGTYNNKNYATSILEITTGFVAVGTSIGGIKGALAGGVIGLVVGLSTALFELDGNTRKVNKSVTDSSKEWEDYKKSAQNTLNTSLTQIGYSEKLSKELEKLVDSNGKVKKGYEDRVNFILGQFNDTLGTEYKLTDGIITKNGEQVKSYKEVQDEINKTIQLKKAEAYENANQEIYTNALKNQAKYFKERTEAQKEASKAESEFSKYLEENGLTLEDYNEYIKKSGNLWEQNFTKYKITMDGMDELDRDRLNSLSGNYEGQKGILEEAEKNWKESTDTIIKQEELKENIISGNNEKIQKSIQELSNSYEENGVTQTLSLAQQIEKESSIRDRHIQLLKDKGQEATDVQKEQWNAQVVALSETLQKQSQELETLTPEVVEGWKSLAEHSNEIYQEKINLISPATRLAIESTIGQVDLNNENVKNRWRNLATNSENEYNRILGRMPEDTRRQIEAITGRTSSLAYSVNNQFAELGKGGANAFSSNFKSWLNLGKIHFGINTDTGKLEFRKYAIGGLPETGQMFIARESGPELVGKIGSQSAVVNNQQIVEAVSRGVASAVSSVMGNVGGGSYNLYIDGRQITDVVQERINRHNNIVGA